MHSLCKALLFVVESNYSAQFLSQLQFFWAPGSDNRHTPKQTNKLNGRCSDSAASSVNQHHLTLFHLSWSREDRWQV